MNKNISKKTIFTLGSVLLVIITIVTFFYFYKNTSIKSYAYNVDFSNKQNLDYSTFRYSFKAAPETQKRLSKVDQVVFSYGPNNNVLGTYASSSITLLSQEGISQYDMTVNDLGLPFGNYIKGRSNVTMTAQFLDKKGRELYIEKISVSDPYFVRLHRTPDVSGIDKVEFLSFVDLQTCTLYTPDSKKISSLTLVGGQKRSLFLSGIPKGTTEIYAKCITVGGDEVYSDMLKL